MNDLNKHVEELAKKIKPPYYSRIEVDEGWYQLVIDCDNELSKIDPKYSLFQVKEKFGGLRYYFQSSEPGLRDEMDEIVAKYEEIASKTCEATGLPGVLMKSIGGWRKTLNPEYAAGTLHHGKYSVVKSSSED
jgi:hypothetical protein